MKKRGLSPVVATVLLIAIVLVLALIIFLWARGFLQERTQKFNEPIENSCPRVNFEAEAFAETGSDADEGYIDVVNRGNVPLYGLEIRRRGIGAIIGVGTFSRAILNGETGRISIQEEVRESNILQNMELELVPIILGEKGTEFTPYTCEKEYKEDAKVQSI